MLLVCSPLIQVGRQPPGEDDEDGSDGAGEDEEEDEDESDESDGGEILLFSFLFLFSLALFGHLQPSCCTFWAAMLTWAGH
jgi:hypothetical protein